MASQSSSSTVSLAGRPVARHPKDDLYYSLRDEIDTEWIGVCLAPGTIAIAVHSGPMYAREVDSEIPVGIPFLRKR